MSDRYGTRPSEASDGRWEIVRYNSGNPAAQPEVVRAEYEQDCVVIATALGERRANVILGAIVATESA